MTFETADVYNHAEQLMNSLCQRSKLMIKFYIAIKYRRSLYVIHIAAFKKDLLLREFIIQAKVPSKRLHIDSCRTSENAQNQELRGNESREAPLQYNGLVYKE